MYKCQYRATFFREIFRKINMINIKTINEQYKQCKKLQILYFSMKNKKIKNLKNGEKKWLDIGIYTYYS